MSDTLTRYLRLRLSDALTPASKYNLLRIDDAFSRLTLSLAGNTTVRGTGDIVVMPEDPDIGGSGVLGSVSLGSISHTLAAINLYGPVFGITSLTVTGAISGASLTVTGVVTAASVTTTGDITAGGRFFTNGGELNIKDTGAGGTAYLGVRYNSTLSGSVDPTNRLLSFDVQGASRSLILGGDLTLGVALATSGAGSLTLTTTGGTNVTLPTTGTLATLAGAETLTNKTMSGAANTFSNIPYAALLLSGAIQNSDLAGGISATKIGAGSVDNTEFGYLDGVGSPIQAQLDSKASRSLGNLTVPGLAAGDLLYATSSSTLARIPLGSAGQVLTAAGIPAWLTPTAGAAVLIRVNYIDLTATVLPVGVAYSPDGIPVVNGDKVLFTALLSGNSRVYQVSGVGTALSWTPLSVFASGLDPSAGDQALAAGGTALGGGVATGYFDGTVWRFGFSTRRFVGSDYWEESGLFTATLADNTTGNVFTVAPTGSENWVIRFSISRGAAKEVGTLHLTTDGVTAAVAENSVDLSGGSPTTGVTFSADISGGLLRLRYTTTSTGVVAVMKWFHARWSAAAGGPASVPNYTITASEVPAAGSTGSIQIKGSTGFLDFDADLTYDTTEDAIVQAGTYTQKRQTATLADNTAAPTDVITLPVSWTYVVIHFGVTRGADRAVGRMLLTNDGVTTFLSDDMLISSPSIGITFTPALSAGLMRVQYTTTATGSSASMSYNVKKWT